MQVCRGYFIFFAYHDREKINQNHQIKNFCTSEENPIQFKQLQVIVTLDNIEKILALPADSNIDGVISEVGLLFKANLQKSLQHKFH